MLLFPSQWELHSPVVGQWLLILILLYIIKYLVSNLLSTKLPDRWHYFPLEISSSILLILSHLQDNCQNLLVYYLIGSPYFYISKTFSLEWFRILSHSLSIHIPPSIHITFYIHITHIILTQSFPAPFSALSILLHHILCLECSHQPHLLPHGQGQHPRKGKR